MSSSPTWSIMASSSTTRATSETLIKKPTERDIWCLCNYLGLWSQRTPKLWVRDTGVMPGTKIILCLKSGSKTE